MCLLSSSWRSFGSERSTSIRSPIWEACGWKALIARSCVSWAIYSYASTPTGTSSTAASPTLPATSSIGRSYKRLCCDLSYSIISRTTDAGCSFRLLYPTVINRLPVLFTPMREADSLKREQTPGQSGLREVGQLFDRMYTNLNSLRLPSDQQYD